MTAALLSEHRQRRSDSIQNALDVDIDHPVPLIDLEIVEGRQRHQTGVTDQYVEPAEAILRLLDKQRQIFTFGDVDRLNIHLAFALANVVGDGFQPVGPACAENDLRSGSGQYSS